MRAVDFQQKWIGVTLKERSASQEHFIDLCHVLGVDIPASADPDGTFYTFERGAAKLGGGGWSTELPLVSDNMTTICGEQRANRNSEWRVKWSIIVRHIYCF